METSAQDFLYRTRSDQRHPVPAHSVDFDGMLHYNSSVILKFNELRRDLEGISQKVLTDSLRSMEEDGIVIRTVFAEVPLRVEYSLSELGESMNPILDAMEAWGTAYKESLERQ
ncbi:MAG: helix-turn-helix transcriptional regulator [Lachnospiraceae bacterium]|nr:helix-turn-helix transcriptional regulator [Lachnospiraceae bacterium]